MATGSWGFRLFAGRRALQGGLAFLLLASAPSFLLSAPQAKKSDHFAREFARGVQRQQAGDLPGAQRAYESALKLDPRSAEVLGNLGTVYSRQGNLERAIECYTQALAINRTLEPVRFQLALAYFRARQFDAARLELVQIVNADPVNFQAHHLLGLVLLKLNRPNEAVAELERVAAAAPGNTQAVYTLASVYLTAGQLDKVEPIAVQLQKDPSAEARYIVGSYYVAKSLHDKAIPELERALALNPQLPDVRTQLGYAYLFKGRRQEATTLFEGEMALNSEDMNAAAFLGWLYRQDGRLEDAERLLEKARLLRPLDPDVLFQLGLLAQSKKQYEEAIVFFNRVAAVNPDHAPAHIVLVRVYSRLKRAEDMRREQAIVDRLNAEQKNQPTVKQKVLYEVITKPLEQRD